MDNIIRINLNKFKDLQSSISNLNGSLEDPTTLKVWFSDEPLVFLLFDLQKSDIKFFNLPTFIEHDNLQECVRRLFEINRSRKVWNNDILKKLYNSNKAKEISLRKSRAKEKILSRFQESQTEIFSDYRSDKTVYQGKKKVFSY